MYKKLFGVLLGVFVIWGSTVAFGQCGASIKRTTQTCGGHCGSVIMQSCQGGDPELLGELVKELRRHILRLDRLQHF